LSAGTWISPKASLSVLVFAAILVALPWKYLWCWIAGVMRRFVRDGAGTWDDAVIDAF
jgi:hypothetical protein